MHVGRQAGPPARRPGDIAEAPMSPNHTIATQSSDKLLFWRGKSGWTSDPAAAHTYQTTRRAVQALSHLRTFHPASRLLATAAMAWPWSTSATPANSCY